MGNSGDELHGDGGEGEGGDKQRAVRFLLSQDCAPAGGRN